MGYELPRWGIDGDLGSETFEAFARFARDHDVAMDEDDDEITDAHIELLETVHRETTGAPFGPALAVGPFHDLRSIAATDNVGGHRTWKNVTGITLHQTACVLGEKPKRWSTVGAHLGVTRGGQVIWLHDFTRIVWHANLLNSTTIGIEMDGTYEGVEGDEDTFWRPADEPDREPQLPTDELVEAASATVRWICDEVKRHGGRVSRLFAHRQASSSRRSDPGSALWKRVALPLHQALGLDAGVGNFVVGTGIPIPERWDSTRVGIPY